MNQRRVPYIKIELVDETNTWISMYPVIPEGCAEIDTDAWVPDQVYYAAERAAGEAFAMFLGNLVRERPAVRRHLLPFRKRR